MKPCPLCGKDHEILDCPNAILRPGHNWFIAEFNEPDSAGKAEEGQMKKIDIEQAAVIAVPLQKRHDETVAAYEKEIAQISERLNKAEDILKRGQRAGDMSPNEWVIWILDTVKYFSEQGE